MARTALPKPLKEGIKERCFGESGYGLFLSLIRQGLFYTLFILVLPRVFGVNGLYFSQPAEDVLTLLVCLCSIRRMKAAASRNMGHTL